MSLENEMTAKIFGEILAKGMRLADCELENEIESESLKRLKEIQSVISSREQDRQKLELVEKIITGQKHSDDSGIKS